MTTSQRRLCRSTIGVGRYTDNRFTPRLRFLYRLKGKRVKLVARNIWAEMTRMTSAFVHAGENVNNPVL